ncbi:MAG: peptidyl-prolyl cis-trans isomerase [Candidatus Omnitrophica bacterium]|nr:peptidyl-prolyl cis-trans isomerase [Candidatus Omnitrophota bacterium]
MRKSAGFFIVLFSFAFILFGCDQISKLSPKKDVDRKSASAITVKGAIVAKVNNIPLSLGDLSQEIEAYNAAVPADRPELKITTREQKVNYLKNEMIRRALLYQEGLDKGLDREAEVTAALEKTKMQLVVLELIKQETEKIDVSSKEIEDYYNTYKEQLKEPEERQIREIVVPSEQEAKEMLILLLQGSDFATLAKERSKSSSAKQGGNLDYIKKGKKFAQFDGAAFSDTLEVGKISSIFKGPDGYYIVELEAKRGGRQKPISDMWDDIKRGLTFLKQQQKIEALIGKLSRDAKIEVYEGEVK